MRSLQPGFYIGGESEERINKQFHMTSFDGNSRGTPVDKNGHLFYIAYPRLYAYHDFDNFM